MGGVRDGIFGTEGAAHPDRDSDLLLDVFGGGDPPGILGTEPAIPLDDISRTIAKVEKDWDPPNPRTSPAITVGGKTLTDAFNALNRQPEWGEGGGQIRADRIPPGNSTNLTVKLHANLVRRMPTWTGYAKASVAVKAEWDRMISKLAAHEDRHVAIAVEEADQLAKDLVGKDISEIAQMVTDANARMQQRQQELDDSTDHGAKPGATYGDVTLDPNL
jgi:cell division septum initiation protein DivIVA